MSSLGRFKLCMGMLMLRFYRRHSSASMRLMESAADYIENLVTRFRNLP